MKVCPNCHKQVNVNNLFCPFCGYKFAPQNNNPQNYRKPPTIRRNTSSTKKIISIIVVIAIVLISIIGGKKIYKYHEAHTIHSMDMRKELPRGDWTFTYDGRTWHHVYFHNTYSTTSHGGQVGDFTVTPSRGTVKPYIEQLTVNPNVGNQGYDGINPGFGGVYITFKPISHNDRTIRFKAFTMNVGGTTTDNFKIHGNKVNIKTNVGPGTKSKKVHINHIRTIPNKDLYMTLTK